MTKDISHEIQSAKVRASEDVVLQHLGNMRLGLVPARIESCTSWSGDDREAMYGGSLEGQLDLLEKENASLKRKLAMQSDLDFQGYEHMRDELQELKTALAPLVEWWKVEKQLEERFGISSDCVLGFTHNGVMRHKVTVSQLDAIARMVGDTV